MLSERGEYYHWMADAEEMGRVMEGYAQLETIGALEEVEFISADREPGLLRIGGALTTGGKMELVDCLQGNVDVFAWSAAEMPGIDAEVAFHRLHLDPEGKPIRQKKRASTTVLADPIRGEVQKLLEAGFVTEIQYPGWVSNVVMVKKARGLVNVYRFLCFE